MLRITTVPVHRSLRSHTSHSGAEVGASARCDAPRDLGAADAASDRLIGEVSSLVSHARRTAVRSVNMVMTTTYWEIGRRIVAFEQGGVERAAYGTALIQRNAEKLTPQFGRGFGKIISKTCASFTERIRPRKIRQRLIF